MKSMFSSYAPTFEMEGGEGGGDGGGTAVAESPSGTEGAESSTAKVETAAGAESASGAEKVGATVDESTRTYTGKELGEKVSARLKEEFAKHGIEDWKALGVKPSEVKERLARLDAIDKASKGAGAEKALTPAQIEDKKLREFMLEKFPELKDIESVRETQKLMSENVYKEKAASADGWMDQGFKKDFGIEDKAQLGYLRSQVAASIMANPQDRAAWFKTHDMKVVEKHYDLMKSTLEPILRSTAARYVSDKKGQLGKLPPSMPKGGLPEPTSKKVPLTDDERTKGAYALLKAAEAEGN